MSVFDRIEYLREGTARQRLAYRTLSDLGIFDVLAKYCPVLAGTVPIDLDVESSDLDIVCEAHDLDTFEKDVAEAYGRFAEFEIHRTESMGVPASVVNFRTEHFPVQIFAQGLPVARQRAYRHMIAEARLLRLAGEGARRALRALRRQGVKTEPAFGEYFRLEGDPYDKLYDLAEASDQELLAIIDAAAAARASASPGRLVIREATRHDLAGILALQRLWVEEGITYGLAADDEVTLENRLGPYLRVAEIDGRVVGFVAGAAHVSDGLAVIPRGVRYIEIVDLYVHPSVRSRRIGGKLLDDLLEVARKEGLRAALVYSATKDIRRVLRFYERHGFASWYVQMYREL